jgi:hypothetical protein
MSNFLQRAKAAVFGAPFCCLCDRQLGPPTFFGNLVSDRICDQCHNTNNSFRQNTIAPQRLVMESYTDSNRDRPQYKIGIKDSDQTRSNTDVEDQLQLKIEMKNQDQIEDQPQSKIEMRDQDQIEDHPQSKISTQDHDFMLDSGSTSSTEEIDSDEWK